MTVEVPEVKCPICHRTVIFEGGSYGSLLIYCPQDGIIGHWDFANGEPVFDEWVNERPKTESRTGGERYFAEQLRNTEYWDAYTAAKEG